MFLVDLMISALRFELETSLATQTPVVAVVAVMGTTEESAIDPLSDIFALRDEFRKKVSTLLLIKNFYLIL